jgi:hypothetical protein
MAAFWSFSATFSNLICVACCSVDATVKPEEDVELPDEEDDEDDEDDDDADEEDDDDE